MNSIQNYSRWILLGLTAALGTSCSSMPKARVARMESGNLASVSAGKNEPDARQAALEEATEYCEEQGRQAVFHDSDVLGDKNAKKKMQLNLAALPYIGKVFKDGDRSQVAIAFRCEGAGHVARVN